MRLSATEYGHRRLLLLTNDGELAHRLTHPSFGVDKEYLAHVEGTPNAAAVTRLRKGVELEDGITAPAKVATARRLVVAHRDPRRSQPAGAAYVRSRRSSGHPPCADAHRPVDRHRAQGGGVEGVGTGGSPRALQSCGHGHAHLVAFPSGAASIDCWDRINRCVGRARVARARLDRQRRRPRRGPCRRSARRGCDRRRRSRRRGRTGRGGGAGVIASRAP